MYAKHFALVDGVSSHFDGAINGLDAFTVSRYAGLYAVSSAAVLELALKEIIIDFARSRDLVFGEYVATRYKRLNGRISMDDIKNEHLKPFGSEYLKAFGRIVRWIDNYSIKRRRGSLISSYENLLECRHKFAHEGQTTCTYEEVKFGFESGKKIMACLNRALQKPG